MGGNTLSEEGQGPPTYNQKLTGDVREGEKTQNKTGYMVLVREGRREEGEKVCSQIVYKPLPAFF